MKKFLRFIFITSLCLTSHLSAISLGSETQKTTLLSTVDFEGDRHGDFKGDLVAVLSDESMWKIHPKDTEKYIKWQLEDSLHINVRTSHYWFKREHKFEIYNTTRRESVRAMLIAPSPTNANVITGIEMRDVSTTIHSYSYIDADNKLCTVYYPVTHQEKILILNDGSIWSIRAKSHFKNYQVGDRVFIGTTNNINTALNSFFIVQGNEREATWTWCTCQGLIKIN
jgi:hypothetical protein